MSFDTTIDLDIGKLRKDLRTLKQLAPEYRKEVAPRLKMAALPMLLAAKAAVPAEPPTSGWPTGKNSRFRWSTPRIRQQMVLQFKAAGFRGRREDVLLRMYSRNAAMNLFDLAKRSHRNKPSTLPWINSMTLYYGNPSRIMWATAEKFLPRINAEVIKVIDDISRRAQSEIRRNRP